MKILIIDQDNAAVDFAIKCRASGHTVRVFTRPTKWGRSKVGDGLYEKVPHWEPHMKWADLIFMTDNTYYTTAIDKYIKEGYPIIGPGSAATRWETDRKHGMDVLRKVGIKTIPDKEFTKYEEAMKYVLESNKRFVSKPNNESNKAMSYVAKSPADLVFMLNYWKKQGMIKDSFVLQEFRPGIEVAVGGWFGPGGFSKHFCINFEHKKLMNKEKGPNTGEMGTVLYYTEDDPLVDKMLRPIEGQLHGINYTGYIDMNCIIDKDGNPWPLEWTMRPGWPLFNIQQALHKGDPAEWMCDLLDGRDTLKVKYQVATGVAMALPDFPYGEEDVALSTGFPIYGVTPEMACGDFHLYEAMAGRAPAMVDGKVKMDEECFVTAGRYPLVVTGVGDTVKESSEKAYKNLKKVEIPNSVMYRTDIGDRCEDQLPELQAMGYCKGLMYE